MTLLISAWLGVGLVFAVPFAARWAARLDPAAAGGTTGFRLLIVPGAILLWPWLTLALVRRRRVT
jgi:hypothetical protein